MVKTSIHMSQVHSNFQSYVTHVTRKPSISLQISGKGTDFINSGVIETKTAHKQGQKCILIQVSFKTIKFQHFNLKWPIFRITPRKVSVFLWPVHFRGGTFNWDYMLLRNHKSVYFDSEPPIQLMILSFRVSKCLQAGKKQLDLWCTR